MTLFFGLEKEKRVFLFSYLFFNFLIDLEGVL